MTVGDIHRFVDQWAPREIAWEKDNPGLQVGDTGERVRGILLALDPTDAVAVEAVQRKANLLVTHHPLLLHPLKSATADNAAGRLVRSLIRWRVNLYSAHTNLDFTRGGTSFALGERLGLRGMTFLTMPFRPTAKIVTFAPEASIETIAAAMGGAGAGHIGNYDDCSFRIAGTGTFTGNRRAHPTVGRRNRAERVEEIRLEMIVARRDIERAVDALKKAHPYEEPAYDVYPLENAGTNFGMGAIGELDRACSLRHFLGILKSRLGCRRLRWTGDPAARVRTVAVCGGAGAELLNAAVHRGADVFVTADVKYHAFHEAADSIALVDAGHYETEFPVLEAVATRLREYIRKERASIPVMTARRSTNPVAYF